MSGRLFQGVIHQMKDAIGRTIGVLDENGAVIACSDLMKIGETRQAVWMWGWNLYRVSKECAICYT